MTVAPLTPAAAPFPTIGAVAGSNAPGDFLAEMLSALAAPATDTAQPVAAAPVVEPFETVAAQPPQEPSAKTPAPAAGTQPEIPDPSPRLGKLDDRAGTPPLPGKLDDRTGTPPLLGKLDDRTGTPPLPGKLDDRAPTSPHLVKVDDQETDPVTSDPCPAVTLPTVPAPTVAVMVVPTAPVPPRLGKVDDRAPKTDNPGKRVGTVANPGLHLGVNHTEHPVNPKHVEPVAPAQREQQPAAETLPVVPRHDKLDDRVTALPTALAPAASVPAGAPATSPVTMPSVTTPTVSAPAPITDQVFGEVTGLTSRGNGTHRITMKLQPEALGEVRVVLTVRDGTVHVRLAAGQEARAALLDGSPELHRLLERTGATETRVVVRELPSMAVATAPSAAPSSQHGTQQDTQQNSQPATQPNQTPTTDTSTTGDRSPDRHAGTRADHLATDGDDNTRGNRTPAPRDVTPIRSVRASATGLDLTM